MMAKTNIKMLENKMINDGFFTSVVDWLKKMTFWKGVFLVLVIAGLYSTAIRFAFGLGAATHLSDSFPWGLWIGFDVLCGVGLSAGGFVVAGAVYVFHLEDYKSISRPAVLTAFLGYVLVVFALMFDLGRPWNIWHPLVMWNPHSAMFELAWCVMLYTTVLALELVRWYLKSSNWKKPEDSPFDNCSFGNTRRHALDAAPVFVGIALSCDARKSIPVVVFRKSSVPFLRVRCGGRARNGDNRIVSSSRAFHREIEAANIV